MTCEQIETDKLWCPTIWAIPDHDYNGKGIMEACCYCGGSKFFSTYPSKAPSSKPTISARPTVISEAPSAEPSSQPSKCVDEPYWFFNIQKNLGCSVINQEPEELCEQFKHIWYKDKNTYMACCECGGGRHKSVAPSSLPSSSPSVLPSITPSLSFLPTKDITQTPSFSPTLSIEPSFFPSIALRRTVGDGESCNFNGDCMNVHSQCIDKVCKVVSSGGGRDRDLERRKGIWANEEERDLTVSIYLISPYREGMTLNVSQYSFSFTFL